MTDLPDKYRPLTFDKVEGQERPVAWMRAQIRSGARQSVLLAGTFGTGKSSCAFIYAKAALCEDQQDGDCCGRCESCREFGERGIDSPNFHFLRCGETGTIDKIQTLLQHARMAPHAADRRVFLLDEAHNLSWRAVQGLLDIVEKPPKWVMFIIVTSDHHDLPASLLSRFKILELALLNRRQARDFLANICQQEGLEFELPALELICGAVIGSPRFLLRALEKVRDWGGISEANVRHALKLDFDGRLTSYVTALLEGDVARQLDVIDTWPDTPTRKLTFLHQFLSDIYLSELRHVERDDPVLRTIPKSIKGQLVERFAEHAARLSIEVETFWEDALATLEPRDGLAVSQLSMILATLDRLINRSSEWPFGERSARIPAPPTQRRLRILSSQSTSPSAFLSWRHVKPFWEIGSYLPQCCGVLFNLRLTVAHGLPSDRHDEGAEVVSQLTRRLTDRILYRSPDAYCHWVYQHEADGDSSLRTRILWAIPENKLDYAVGWLNKYVAAHDAVPRPTLLISAQGPSRSSSAVHFHWQGIRALSRGLSPTERAHDETGNAVPLVDLLKIPKRWRAAVGEFKTAQGKGMSKMLTLNARKRVIDDLPILSALQDKAWHHVERGWELEEYKARLRAQANRDEAMAQLIHRFPREDELSNARRAEEGQLIEGVSRVHPKLRSRHWIGWWQRLPKEG